MCDKKKTKKKALASSRALRGSLFKEERLHHYKYIFLTGSQESHIKPIQGDTPVMCTGIEQYVLPNCICVLQ